MNAETFKSQTDNLIDELENLIHKMPQKGNKSYECQRVTLQLKLNELTYAINGVVDSDFVENKK